MISGDASSPAADRHNLELIGACVFHDESGYDFSTGLCYLNTGLNLQGGIQMKTDIHVYQEKTVW